MDVSDHDSEGDIPELEETLIRQIKNFKPISQLKTSINRDEITTGVVLEFSDEEEKNKNENLAYNNNGYSNAFDLYEDNTDDENNDYISNSPQFTNVTEDGGVIKLILKTGIGSPPSLNSLCRISYSAYLIETEIPFDSSNYHSSHTMIKIGEHGNTIVGLQLALGSMLKGEKSKFIIRPEYAYGMLGCMPRIPPNSEIIYVVEMINFVNQCREEGEEDVGDCNAWSNVHKKLLQLRDEAKDMFQNNYFSKAMHIYAKALKLVNQADLYSDKDEEERKEACIRVNNNIGLCGMKLNKFKYSILAFKRVLELEPYNLKATFLLGKVYRMKNEFNDAQKHLLQARNMAPLNSDIRNELILLSRDLKEYNEANREMCRSIFDPVDPQRQMECNEYDRIRADIENIDSSISEAFDEEINKFLKDDSISKLTLPNLFADNELGIVKAAAVKHNLQLIFKNRIIVLEKMIKS